MSFFIKNDKMLEKYCVKISKVIKKEFDTVDNDEYLNTKIKSDEGKINTNFHDDKVPKEDLQYICLLVDLIDFVFRTGKNYHLQVFLEECKYFVVEKTMPKYIIEDIGITSDESDKEVSDDDKNSDNYSNVEN